jgi:hypothetical protein
MAKKTKQNKTHKEMLNTPGYKGNGRSKPLRFHFTPVRMATIKNTNDNKCWQRCRETRTLILLVGMEISTTIMENSMEAPQKTKNRIAI